MRRPFPAGVRKLIPLISLFLVGILFIAFGGTKYLKFEQIAYFQEEIIFFVASHPFLSLVIFFLIYLIVTATLIPGLLVLDMVAGFIFVQPIAFFIVLVSLALGGIILFVASRHAFKDLLKNKEGKWITKIQKGFEKYQDGYLVFLRVVPFFPFGAISIALGFTRISLFKFTWTTVLGSLPSIFILTSAGRELGHLVSEGFSERELMSPRILIIYGLFIVAVLAPLFIKKSKRVDSIDSDDCDK